MRHEGAPRLPDEVVDQPEDKAVEDRRSGEYEKFDTAGIFDALPSEDEAKKFEQTAPEADPEITIGRDELTEEEMDAVRQEANASLKPVELKAPVGKREPDDENFPIPKGAVGRVEGSMKLPENLPISMSKKSEAQMRKETAETREYFPIPKGAEGKVELKSPVASPESQAAHRARRAAELERAQAQVEAAFYAQGDKMTAGTERSKRAMAEASQRLAEARKNAAPEITIKEATAAETGEANRAVDEANQAAANEQLSAESSAEEQAFFETGSRGYTERGEGGMTAGQVGEYVDKGASLKKTGGVGENAASRVAFLTKRIEELKKVEAETEPAAQAQKMRGFFGRLLNRKDAGAALSHKKAVEALGNAQAELNEIRNRQANPEGTAYAGAIRSVTAAAKRGR
ncbi:MAG: hypothetical protein PHT12_00700 [Patescibacteria group bacterium]|nr:hypothetical protein [Patescibacteria group bacterium]